MAKPRTLASVSRVRWDATATLRGQIDISARVISVSARLGWASEVRWTNPQRLARTAARR